VFPCDKPTLIDPQGDLAQEPTCDRRPVEHPARLGGGHVLLQAVPKRRELVADPVPEPRSRRDLRVCHLDPGAGSRPGKSKGTGVHVSSALPVMALRARQAPRWPTCQGQAACPSRPFSVQEPCTYFSSLSRLPCNRRRLVRFHEHAAAQQKCGAVHTYRPILHNSAWLNRNIFCHCLEWLVFMSSKMLNKGLELSYSPPACARSTSGLRRRDYRGPASSGWSSIQVAWTRSPHRSGCWGRSAPS